MQNYPEWMVWHFWNRADCGAIYFAQAGRQLLTLHYKQGNNLAYFDFVPEPQNSVATEKPSQNPQP